MQSIPASPARLGRIALALTLVPALALAILIGGGSQTETLIIAIGVLFAVPGPVAVIVAQVAGMRWRRQKSLGFPWCGLLACLIGGIETSITAVMWFGWPRC